MTLDPTGTHKKQIHLWSNPANAKIPKKDRDTGVIFSKKPINWK